MLQNSEEGSLEFIVLRLEVGKRYVRALLLGRTRRDRVGSHDDLRKSISILKKSRFGI